MSGTNNNPYLNGALDPALQNAARLGLANVNVSGVVPDYQQPIMSGGGGDFWYPGFGGVAQPTYTPPGTTTPPVTTPAPTPTLDPTNGGGGPVGQTGGEFTGGFDSPGTGGSGTDNPGGGLPSWGGFQDFMGGLPGAASGMLNVVTGGLLGSAQGAGPGTADYRGGSIGQDEGDKFGGSSTIGADEGDKAGGRGSMGAGGGGSSSGGGGSPGPIGYDEGSKNGLGPVDPNSPSQQSDVISAGGDATDQVMGGITGGANIGLGPGPSAQAAAAQALAGVNAGSVPADPSDQSSGLLGTSSSAPSQQGPSDVPADPGDNSSGLAGPAPSASSDDGNKAGPAQQTAFDQNAPDPAAQAQAGQQNAANTDPGDNSTGFAKGGPVNNVIPPQQFAAMQALRGVHAGGAPPNSKPGGFAAGGPVTPDALQGPNPPGPDEGFAALQPGEEVVNKAAAQNPANAASLQAMNAGAVVPPPGAGAPMPPPMPMGGGMPGAVPPGMPTDPDAGMMDTDDVDPMMAAQNLANLDPGQRSALAQAVADPQVSQALVAILGAAFVPIVQQMAGAPGPMQTMDSWGDGNAGAMNGDGPYDRDPGMGMAMTPTNSPPLAGPPPSPGSVAPNGFPPPDTAGLTRMRAAQALQGVAA